MAEQKFYVVWEGHRPGIYTSWTDAQLQIKGFKGAKFKSFKSKRDAEFAFKNPHLIDATANKKKQYYYVIWAGHQPGVYSDWDEARQQITGFKGSKYKTFGSEKLAHKAYQEGPENYQGNYKKTKDLTDAELRAIGSPIELSLTVDAACNGSGLMEYQGVWMFNQEKPLFQMGPLSGGSNNIGEFLALVHALALFAKETDPKFKKMPIYSDSKIAMGWIRAKTCRTKQKPSPKVAQLIWRAEQWLRGNHFENPILKWETKVWGEIPADFGRK